MSGSGVILLGVINLNTALLEKQTMSRRIVVNGEYRTRRDNACFVVSHSNNSFLDEMQRTGVADAVLGEFVLRIDGESESEFDSQRSKLGLQLSGPVHGVTRANIAFARFIVVKGYSSLPKELAVRRAGLTNFISVFGICTDQTESMLLNEALRLDIETNEGEYNLDGVSMLLIVDKVYVAEAARRCGVSEYIHMNLADIAHVFIGVRPKLVVLNCGDFSNAHTALGISEIEYKHILRKHYESTGYKSVAGASPFVMWKLL